MLKRHIFIKNILFMAFCKRKVRATCLMSNVFVKLMVHSIQMNEDAVICTFKYVVIHVSDKYGRQEVTAVYLF